MVTTMTRIKRYNKRDSSLSEVTDCWCKTVRGKDNFLQNKVFVIGLSVA